MSHLRTLPPAPRHPARARRHDTGLAAHKLVTVYRLEGQRAPYATMGFAGFTAALAGMSGAGITVSEANLDNGAVGFNGLAWPLRLRRILALATDLGSAKALWAATDNTAAFNFLLGSAGEPGALALETCNGTTEFFDGAPPAAGGAAAVEARSSFTCASGKVYDGVNCSLWWPGAPAPLPLGAPLADAVFRSNHALHPAVMATQEPLWNDTVSRYLLLGERLREAAAAGKDAAGAGAGAGAGARRLARARRAGRSAGTIASPTPTPSSSSRSRLTPRRGSGPSRCAAAFTCAIARRNCSRARSLARC